MNKSSAQFLFYTKCTTEKNPEVNVIGIFPSFESAVQFRKNWLIELKKFHVDPETDPTLMSDFEDMFGGRPDEEVLEDIHYEYVVEEVPVYMK